MSSRLLQSLVLIPVAVLLIALLVQRGGSATDMAQHFSGPGAWPLVPTIPDRTATPRTR